MGTIMLAAASSVSAQDRDHASFVPDVVKKVILDPTTYAPAIVAWEATCLDWQSSQIFFRNGLSNLQLSLVNNVSARAMASYWSYRLSAGHFRQWQENERRAQQLGDDCAA